jgi:hypothetical protein
MVTRLDPAVLPPRQSESARTWKHVRFKHSLDELTVTSGSSIMMSSLRLSALVGTVLLFVSAHAAPPKLAGAIFTTDQDGTLTNGNTQYLSKCGATGVYLDGGPGPNASPRAASLPDGDYYFQVTDPSGKVLLSTDPVRERCFSVAGGVTIGTCPTGTHETYVDTDQGSMGARTVELCAAPDVPFLNTPSDGGEYKVWVTPVTDFVGDPSLVDSDCGGLSGCSHGFRTSRSKSDNFKAREQTSSIPTSCLRVEKQLVFLDAEGTSPGSNWKILVTDAAGVVSTFFTDAQGSTGSQICGLAPGSYTIEEEMQDFFIQVGVFLNGQPVSGSGVLVTIESGATGDQTVVFRNQANFQS